MILKQLREHLAILKGSGVDVIYGTSSKSLTDREIASASHGTLPRNDVIARQHVDAMPKQSRKSSLTALQKTVLGCTKCSELTESRNHVVFGCGSTEAKLVFVGEAPGHDEDLKGLPFVGPAGQLLTKIIESIHLKREEVFICNVLKCRPPNNRNPLPHEIANCEPYLSKQLELIRPKVICALGNFAAQTLLKTNQAISSLRGRFHDFRGAKLMCTYHPAYLLRYPEDKRKVWEDMKMIRTELDRT